jgi:hypothetical protein
MSISRWLHLRKSSLSQQPAISSYNFLVGSEERIYIIYLHIYTYYLSIFCTKMSDLAPEYLLEHHHEASSDSVLEEVGSESNLYTTGCSETCASPSSDDTQNSSNTQSTAAIKTKIPTCAELLSVENNNKCFDCNTEVWLRL